MNVNPLIENALTDIGVPTAAVRYEGFSPTYIVYRTRHEGNTEWADNKGILESTNVTVSIFSDTDSKILQKEIRKRLRRAGFKIQGTIELYDEETNRLHAIIEIVYESVSEDIADR